eukprot:5879535-Amphidinium_carterae.1
MSLSGRQEVTAGHLKWGGMRPLSPVWEAWTVSLGWQHPLWQKEVASCEQWMVRESTPMVLYLKRTRLLSDYKKESALKC